ncbi:hypothetical protein BDW59DRAFT_175228 [Aspergillus cavernicola]|uniref:Protein kinase domain-containing protein n=1 Tax=Aspergillus cavernicola TaxID=176166 RepID=A0ABR4HRY4_9EURO
MSISNFKSQYPCRFLTCLADLRSPSEPRVFPRSEVGSDRPFRPVYPFHISKAFNHRYQVVGKLGYGSSATDRDHHYLPDRVMTSDMVRKTMRNILAALDFLHTEARVIHTAEFDALVPRKILHGHTIYLSRPLPILLGTPVLCDLGEARLGTDQQQGGIISDIYRAPEVTLGMDWDYEVHIWNVGMVLTVRDIWDIFEHHHLFKARDSEPRLDDGIHLAEMQAVLVSPLLEFLSRSERSLEFWDENDSNLEDLEKRLQGEEKDDLLRFLRRILCWIPEERATAKELLFDP